MNQLSKLLLAAGFAAAATTAQATTITASKNVTERAQITCDDCVGYVAANTTGAAAAQTENATPSTKGIEADFVNRMTGSTSFDARDATKVRVGNVDTLEFNASFQYIVFKIGNQRFLVENGTKDAAIAFSAVAGTRSGLSHYTGFGAAPAAPSAGSVASVARVVATVPAPAAGLLLGSVVLAGGLIARRRRKSS